MISIRLFLALSFTSKGMNSERPAAINWVGLIVELLNNISITAVDLKTDNSQLFLGEEALANLSVSVCPSTIISKFFSFSNTFDKSISAFRPYPSTKVLPDANNNFASKLT